MSQGLPGTALEAGQIRQRLPHAGAMCLLESVEYWDATRISCLTQTHRSTANPLRGEAGLGSANAIEYAAQAMALHAGLAGSAEQPAAGGHGVLASVRAVQLLATRLDEVAGPLQVEAELLLGDATSAQYRFAVQGDGRALVTGRLSVLFVTNSAA